MKEQLFDILDFNKSIINTYLDNFNNYWDLLKSLNSLIVFIGNNLDKTKYDKLEPNIWISKTADIDSTARIVGPCIIGHDSEIRFNAFIRGNVIIGNRCVIGNSSEVKNSVLFDESKIPHFNYIGDSILGYKSHLGAGALTSNVKSDESCVNVILNGNKYQTNMKKLGAIIGDNVEIGCNCVLIPGTIIGRNSTVYPLTMVRGEIGSNKIVKAINQIVEKENRM